MPVKEEEPKVEDKPSCDHIIGLDSTGYAYSPASLTIKVEKLYAGNGLILPIYTMCRNFCRGDQMRKEGGIYSGETAKTVDLDILSQKQQLSITFVSLT